MRIRNIQKNDNYLKNNSLIIYKNKLLISQVIDLLYIFIQI